MSESYREQHPLLYEELSEEEQFSPRYQRRFRPMVFKGRARSNVKGAAAIIRLWPGHWSSSVTYWWIAIGMIGLITIIVYNSVVVFSMLPPGHFKEPRLRPVKAVVNPVPEDTRSSFNVYMHLFVENNQEIDLNSYMPYIDIIANKYPDFKYHLIVVFNDTSSETNNLSAEENNEIALDLLWGKNNVHQSYKNNVVIERMTLSNYMNNSPLRENWKKLPQQFLQFLTRAVSIWDKGGIAFNPTILTPRSPHAIYIERVQNLLKNYHHTLKKNVIERKTIKKQHSGIKKKVNNIRDIIDALEHDDEDLYSTSLENSNDEAMSNQKRVEKTNSPVTLRKPVHSKLNMTTDFQHSHPYFSNLLKNKSVVDAKFPESEETLVMAESNVDNVTMKFQQNNDTSAFGILPMFLEYLFRNKPVSDSSKKVTDKLPIVTRKRKHAIDKSSIIQQSADHSDRKINDKLRPIIIPAKDIPNPEKIIEIDSDKSDDGNQLTIDLKGNIVSSATPCHAFLGTVFSNPIHHIHESLTDFIITELSIFCKGALSSCKGIDVILL